MLSCILAFASNCAFYVSFCLGSAEGEEVDKMSTYDQLIQQVETLKLENSTLKKELCSNTSQINRLESDLKASTSIANPLINKRLGN